MTKKEVNIQPLGSKILVSPMKLEEKTTGGLILPPSATEDQKPETGIVVKLGTGINEKGEKINFGIKVGDRIFFKSYSPDEIEIEGNKYFLVDNSDILAII
jgi:chaperonin GroES